MIVCEPNPLSDSFQDRPKLIAEVLSMGTRRIDLGEKKNAYLSLPSLSLYLVAEQQTACVIVYRRTPAGFEREEYRGLQKVIPLPEFSSQVALEKIYAGISEEAEEEIDAGRAYIE